MRIPGIDSTLDAIAEQQPKFFSTVDLEQGFFQIGMDEASQDKTAFITHEGKFVFKRMPMSLRGSPATFQSCADAIFFWNKLQIFAGVFR